MSDKKETLVPSVLSGEMQEMAGTVQILIKSGLFPDTASVSQGMVKVMAGNALGIEPFTAMRDIHIINGKTCLSAGLVASKIKSSGKYDYRIIKHDAENCELNFYEKRDGAWCLLGVSKFTVEDAKNAGLIRAGGMYQKYGRNMMFSRALTNGARWYCPDVFGGAVYTPDEMDKTKEPEVIPTTVVPVNELGAELSEKEVEEMKQAAHEAVKQGVAKNKLEEQ